MMYFTHFMQIFEFTTNLGLSAVLWRVQRAMSSREGGPDQRLIHYMYQLETNNQPALLHKKLCQGQLSAVY